MGMAKQQKSQIISGKICSWPSFILGPVDNLSGLLVEVFPGEDARSESLTLGGKMCYENLAVFKHDTLT